ncbi:MAG: hypothetical protein ICV59_09200 [Thermoleophilia bacterium]|nr:hypothetical protein [Thermoleophilia bacterium]
MNTRARSPLRDPELVEMLASTPELLAIADALVRTEQSGMPAASGRARAHALVASTIAAALVAVVAVLLLIAPWQGSGSLVDKALAAVGNQDVLHVVIERPERPGESLIGLATGAAVPRSERTEIWFDDARDLKKTVTNLDGEIVDETLETPEGGWTQGGPIYTCAWIAAHPVEATRAGVSCNPSGENLAKPRTIPERPPTIDQALAGFVDRYRSALASGQAEQIGNGELEGRDVIWLRMVIPVAGAGPGMPSRLTMTEDVAVDAETFKPLLVQPPGGPISFRVLSINTVPYDPSLFTKPQPVEGQAGGNVSPGTAVTLEHASSILGGRLYWLGREWRDLRLVEVTHHRPTVTFSLGSQRRRERVDVIGLIYARASAAGAIDERPAVTIYQAARCVTNVGMTCSPRGPSDGQLLLQSPMPSFVRLDGRYIAVWDSLPQSQAEALELGRALKLREVG